VVLAPGAAAQTLSEVLNEHGLSQFLEPLLKLGVETIGDLSDPELLTDAELQIIVGLKVLQVRRLRRAAQPRPTKMEFFEVSSPNQFYSSISLQHYLSFQRQQQQQMKQKQENEKHEDEEEPPSNKRKRRQKPPPRPRRKTKFLGVTDDLSRNPQSNSWRAQITKAGKVRFLGRFATGQAAARAYDNACAEAGMPRKNFPVATCACAALYANDASLVASPVGLHCLRGLCGVGHPGAEEAEVERADSDQLSTSS